MKNHNQLPKIQDLKEGVAYNPASGKMVWLVRPVSHFRGERAERECKRWNGIYAGKPALSHRKSDGYLCGTFGGLKVSAHRVAWAVYFGVWPEGEVDHINGDRSDNRIENLRIVTRAENNRNKASRNGVADQGVSKGRYRDNWVAQIGDNGKTVHIGTFETKQAAIAARKAAESRMGFHPNHGRRA